MNQIPKRQRGIRLSSAERKALQNLSKKIRGNYSYTDKESPLLTYVYEYIDSVGIPTLADFSFYTGVSLSTIYALANGIMAPYSEKSGEFRQAVVKLCDFLDVDASDLFPRYSCKFPVDTTIHEEILTNETAHEDVLTLKSVSPEDLFASIEFSVKMLCYFESVLSRKNFYVLIVCILGELPFAEIAEELGVSISMARVRYEKAIKTITRISHTPDKLQSHIPSYPNSTTDIETQKFLKKHSVQDEEEFFIFLNFLRNKHKPTKRESFAYPWVWDVDILESSEPESSPLATEKKKRKKQTKTKKRSVRSTPPVSEMPLGLPESKTLPSTILPQDNADIPAQSSLANHDEILTEAPTSKKPTIAQKIANFFWRGKGN